MAWFHFLRLEKWIVHFSGQCWLDAITMSEEDLITMGITMQGTRDKLLRAFKSVYTHREMRKYLVQYHVRLGSLLDSTSEIEIARKSQHALRAPPRSNFIQTYGSTRTMSGGVMLGL